MLRNLTVLIAGLASAFVLTGCPDKKAEKEAPASADDPVAEQNAAAEDKKTEAKTDEKAADKAAAEEDKKDEKEEGGW